MRKIFALIHKDGAAPAAESLGWVAAMLRRIGGKNRKRLCPAPPKAVRSEADDGLRGFGTSVAREARQRKHEARLQCSAKPAVKVTGARVWLARLPVGWQPLREAVVEYEGLRRRERYRACGANPQRGMNKQRRAVRAAE